MTIIECPREQDVLNALATEQWPDRSGEELRAHVAACGICSDLAVVAGPLGEVWGATRGDVHVPASGMVWWRAQMRARREASRAAARPIVIAQTIGGLIAVVLIAASILFLSPWLLASLDSSRALLAPGAQSVLSFPQGWVLGGVVAVIAAASLAVYLAVVED